MTNERIAVSEWERASSEVQRAMNASWENGMPSIASATYSRWWQLESWLRSLVYVELKAEKGSSWADELPNRSQSRQLGDQVFGYMATPDARDRLAYTDASDLFQITLEHWDLFERSLISKKVWEGRIEELKAIRNRIGHCRRPHFDDLTRLEQTLRDLNKGAFLAASSFNDQWHADGSWVDDVVESWVRQNHDDAIRLIKHAERQYDTIFELRYSRRPWAKLIDGSNTISGMTGYVWHAFWHFRGGRTFNLEKFWRDVEPYRDVILIVCADSSSSIQVSFSTMDDSKVIANVIGRCFDSALYNLDRGREPDDFIHWQSRYADLDPQVHVGTAWSMIEESMRGVSIFGA